MIFGFFTILEVMETQLPALVSWSLQGNEDSHCISVSGLSCFVLIIISVLRELSSAGQGHLHEGHVMLKCDSVWRLEPLCHIRGIKMCIYLVWS